MKDYYYILGVKETATTEEVKKAYRKLSLRLHPDQNGGDEFFAQRFKEIVEAYETLVDSSKRTAYNNLKSRKSGQSGTNFTPEIEYFKSDKQSFRYQEEVTFFWKTINADKVVLRPFGTVPPIGNKTIKLKEFKDEFLTFELVAENSNIGRSTSSFLKLSNKTYKELYEHFKEKFNKEKQGKPADPPRGDDKKNDGKDEFPFNQWVAIYIIVTITCTLIYFLTHRFF